MDQIWLAARSSLGITLAVVALPVLLVGIGAASYQRLPHRWRPAALRTARLTAVAIALAVVAAVTLTPSSYPVHAINLVPFRDVAAARGGDGLTRSLVNCAGNVALFLPLGGSLALFHPRLRTWVVLGCAVLTSAGIELLQYAPAIGRATDVTDVLTNSAGALAGWFAGLGLRRRLRGVQFCDAATAVPRAHE